MKKRILVIMAAVFLALATVSQAEDIVLVVQGPGPSEEVSFTEEEIRALPKITITTYDTWDNKQRVYEGCLLLTFLEEIGKAKGIRIIEVIAKNDYRAKITMKELRKYKHLLTYSMDGKDYSQLGEEDKGPLAIAVKIQDIPPSDRPRVKNQQVWWIAKIILK